MDSCFVRNPRILQSGKINCVPACTNKAFSSRCHGRSAVVSRHHCAVFQPKCSQTPLAGRTRIGINVANVRRNASLIVCNGESIATVFSEMFEAKTKAWNEKNATEPSPPWTGVASLSAQVPVAGAVNSDQRPTLIWWAMVVDVLLTIILNDALPDSEDRKEDDSKSLAKVKELKRRLEASVVQARSDSPSTTIGAAPVELTDPPLEYGAVEDLDKEIHEVFKYARSRFVELMRMLKASMTKAESSEPTVTSLEQYNALFRIIPLPDVERDFQKDETFARYRVAGPNPMSIEAVTKETLTCLVGDRISDKEFNAVLDTNGDTVEKAGKDGRLCVVNYDVLSGLDPVIDEGPGFIADPIAVFAQPISGGNHIMPVAIQLGQDPFHSELLFPTTKDKYRWQMAKTVVQVADFNYHELIAHLAHTHLVMEAFSVATQRRLLDDHPVSRLLRPHLEGTNFINSGAANLLIAENGQIDTIMANGQETRLKSLQALATCSRFSFDFANRSPRLEIGARGMDRVKVFPYRDDVYLIWDAIENWAQDYVDLYYDNDDAVENDSQLAAWSLDISVNANFRNFEVPENKKILVYTLALIMFIGSAQHAAVNFPQVDDMTYAPAIAGACWENLPPLDKGKTTRQDWLNSLPPIDVAVTQLSVLYLLGSVYYRRLGEYHSNEHPYHGTLEAKAEPALLKFRKQLNEVEDEINKRNRKRGSFAYEYLLPSKIPASINI